MFLPFVYNVLLIYKNDKNYNKNILKTSWKSIKNSTIKLIPNKNKIFLLGDWGYSPYYVESSVGGTFQYLLIKQEGYKICKILFNFCRLNSQKKQKYYEYLSKNN